MENSQRSHNTFRPLFRGMDVYLYFVHYLNTNSCVIHVKIHIQNTHKKGNSFEFIWNICYSSNRLLTSIPSHYTDTYPALLMADDDGNLKTEKDNSWSACFCLRNLSACDSRMLFLHVNVNTTNPKWTVPAQQSKIVWWLMLIIRLRSLQLLC